MAKQEFSQDFTKLPSASDLIKIMAEDPATGGKFFAVFRELMDAYNGSVIAKKSEVTSEATARNQADTTLQQNISNEATTRNLADTSLFEHITNEVSARAQADTTERNARVAADALKLNRDEITITCTLREKDDQGDSQKLIFNDYVFPLSIENGEILKFYHTNTPYNLTVESIDEANSFFADVVFVDSDFQFSGFGSEILIALTIPQDFILKSINAYLQAFEEKFYTRETGIAEYGRRVYSNGGKMNNNQLSDLLYRKNMNLMNEAVFFWDGVLGTTAVNGKASKIYNFKGTNDAVQATDANRPFVSGTIAPNESLKLKNYASASNRFLYLPNQFSIQNNNQWSFTVAFKWYGSADQTQEIFGKYGDFCLRIKDGGNNRFVVITSGVSILSFQFDTIKLVGKSTVISLVYNSDLQLWIDGIFIESGTVLNSAINVDRIFGGRNGDVSNFSGEVFSVSAHNRALSASEIKTHHAALKLLHPDIEGVDIGNQHWATSNYEGVVTGDGTVIPEVRDAAAWAALTTPAWCYYNNDPAAGAIYGKLYNWYAVQAIAKNPPKGWRVPYYADMLQLQTYLGGYEIAGIKIKSNYNNSKGTNESGFSSIVGFRRNEDGQFSIERYNNYYNNSNNGANYMVTHGDWTAYFIDTIDKKAGLSLRLLRNEPTGEDIKCVSTGVFATDIDGAEKQVAIPFGHVVKSIRIKSANNLSNVNCILCDPSGVQMAVLLDDKYIYAGVPRVFNVLYEAPELMQDGTIRMSATGNGGDGMQVDYIIEKSVKSELW